MKCLKCDSGTREEKIVWKGDQPWKAYRCACSLRILNTDDMMVEGKISLKPEQNKALTFQGAVIISEPFLGGI